MTSQLPPTLSEANGVSVIICCFNGAARLSETLRNMAAQQVNSSIAWELLMVDRATQDDTA